MIITITNDGYIMRTPKTEFDIQDIKQIGILKKFYTSRVRIVHEASLEDVLLLFTETGRCYKQKVVDIPSTDDSISGISLTTHFATDETFCSILPINPQTYSMDNSFVLIMSRDCRIIKQKLSDYIGMRNGMFAITLEWGDKISSVVLTKNNNIAINSTNAGFGKIFGVNMIPITLLKSKSKGRTQLRNICHDTKMVDIDTSSNVNSHYLIVTDNGFSIKIKDILLERKMALLSLMRLKDDSNVVFCAFINNDEDLLIVTAKGYTLRYNINLLKGQYRAGIGSLCMTLSADDKIVACCKISPSI